MRRSPKLVLYAVFAAAVFLAALALGRAELVALGAPFALVLIVGLSRGGPVAAIATLRVGGERVVEGQEVEAELVVTAPATVPALRVALHLPDGVRLKTGSDSLLIRVEGGEERVVPLKLACERWGAYRLGDLTMRVHDAAGLLVSDWAFQGEALLRVYPQIERLRAAVRPLETQPFAGNQLSRRRGEGIEFADIRPYTPGDRLRRINWRATSLRQTVHINEEHPEHNSDVVIFLDSFSDVRSCEVRGHEAELRSESTLDLAVRAAASLTEHYLVSRDRVGLVSFGGLVRWLVPASGDVQRYRIAEALLETETFMSFVWRQIDVLPRRSLTPQALVIALSPLLDERSVGALLDLRRRGFDVVVVEISPLSFVQTREDAVGSLALRLWRLRREALRYRYEQAGVAVMQWDGSGPLAAAVEEVRAFRRFARYASG
ncbi:MAG: DUF58 domain-containing protein [Thermoleophilia bacterium]|nr:DUF58 domain-containing protein [Thermoleophilia bacterium]